METEDKNRDRFIAPRSGRTFAGLILVLVGGVLLSRQFGIDIPEWAITWEMFLIALGLFIGARRSFRLGPWIIIILMGSAFLLRDFYPGIFIWHYIWPVAIILFGLWMIMKPRRRKRDWGSWRTEADSSDNIIEANSVFGGAKKKIFSNDFKGGEINTAFR